MGKRYRKEKFKDKIKNKAKNIFGRISDKENLSKADKGMINDWKNHSKNVTEYYYEDLEKETIEEIERLKKEKEHADMAQKAADAIIKLQEEEANKMQEEIEKLKKAKVAKEEVAQEKVEEPIKEDGEKTMSEPAIENVHVNQHAIPLDTTYEKTKDLKIIEKPFEVSKEPIQVAQNRMPEVSDEIIDDNYIYVDPEEPVQEKKHNKKIVLFAGSLVLTGAIAIGAIGYILGSKNKDKNLNSSYSDIINNEPENNVPEISNEEKTEIDPNSIFDPNDEEQLNERANKIQDQVKNIKGVAYSNEQISNMIRVLNGIASSSSQFDARTANTMLFNILSKEQEDEINAIFVEKYSGNNTQFDYELLFGYENYMVVKHFNDLRKDMLNNIAQGNQIDESAMNFYRESVNTFFTGNLIDNTYSVDQLNDGANLVINDICLGSYAIVANSIDNSFIEKNFVTDKTEDTPEIVGIEGMTDILNNNLNVYGTNLQNTQQECLTRKLK